MDTILYSRDAKFSFIFYAVRDKAPDAVTLIGDNATGYTAMAMIGYKEKEHALPKFYPISEERSCFPMIMKKLYICLNINL